MTQTSTFVPSRLNLLAGGMIEAGWLAAALLAPLFFNIYTYRTFEPDKAVLIRGIAIVMLVAWLVKVTDKVPGRQDDGGDIGTLNVERLTFNVLAAAAFGAIYLVATIASVAPGLSLWGSFPRLQGTLTTASYLVIFWLTLRHLRSRQQVDRLVSTLLLSSLVVALYGVLQQLGWDVVVWKAEFGRRVTSTQGNPIFVGAFLVMVAPLTAARLLQTLNVGTLNVQRLTFNVRAGAYATLLALQVLCIVFTLSRGPMLGLLAGLGFLGLLLLVAGLGRRGALVAACAGGLAFVILMGAFLLPQTPLGRVAAALDPARGTARERALTWGGTIDMVAADPLRTLIGYGPESMLVAFPRYFPEELAPLPSVANIAFDRAHNEILDTLATTGILGVLALLFVVGSAFWAGLRSLGLVADRRAGRVFVGTFAGGAILGALLPRLLEGTWRFAGLGLTYGLLFGLAVYCIIHGINQRNQLLAPGMLLPMALLAGLVAHLVELQTGIGIVATRVTFWLFAALLATSAFQQDLPQQAPDPAPADKPVRGGRKRRSVEATARHDESHPASGELIGWALIVGLALATLAFDFISPQINLGIRGLGVLVLLFATWVLGMILMPGVRSAPPPTQAPSIYSFFSLSWFLLFASAHLILIRVIGIDGVGLTLFYMLQILAALGLIAVALVRSQFRPEQPWVGRWVWLYPLAALAGLAFILHLSLNVAWADIYHKQALAYADAGRTDDTIRLYRQALNLAPRQDTYYIYQAGAFVKKAEAANDPESRAGWLSQAEAALERGRSLNPLGVDYQSKLGLLYRIWGDLAPNPETQRERWSRAAAAYAQASALSPQSAQIHREWGDVLRALGDWPAAAEHYRRAAKLNPRTLDHQLLLGDASLALGDLDTATTAYRAALALDTASALKAKEDAVAAAPNDYAAHRNLAFIYNLAGRQDAALAEAEKARNLAPDSDKLALDRVLMEVKR